jgi:4-hydroxybenzoate polyprenyltransferase
MKKYLSLIKFSHTIFAMPFALTGFFMGVVASRTMPEGAGMSWRLLGLVVLCMVFCRSAAMAFNRWLDRDVDALNPRTVVREIPSGTIRPQSALLFVIINCVLFILCTFFINPLCFALSPVALAVVLGYSYTKRFTALCHLVLGVGLGLAPVGAYLAVTGAFAWPPVLLGLAVTTWVAGFDVIYALQDEAFDQSQRLHSIPVWLGTRRALFFSEMLHFASAILLVSAIWAMRSGLPPVLDGLIWVGAVVFLGLLFYQHTLVKANDLRRVNLAFFTTNGIASVIFGVFAILDLLT